MTLADEHLKELDNPSLTENERTLLRCRVAADLIHKGQYEFARETLGELWPGVGEKPDVKGLPPVLAAEVILQCGVLTGWLGRLRSIEGAQEKAQDLITEAFRKFQSQGRHEKASGAQYELGVCYWQLGAYEESRVIMQEALKPLTDADLELKARILIRRTIVELCENKFYEALNILNEARPVFESADDALKGRWHGQMGLVLARLADAEGNTSYTDRAIIEFTAAIYHYEQTGNERYCATNRNNVAMLLYRLGRYRDAHEQLDRAGATLLRLKDAGLLAQVDETRARVFLAEKKYGEADRVITRAIQALEKGGASAYLSDALTIQGVARARLGAGDDSINILRRAMSIAEESGALTNAGLAALALIEEHGARRVLSRTELYRLYLRAEKLLKGSQDAEDKERLLACARVVMRRLADVSLHDRNFSFYSVVQEFEEKIIEQALAESGGSVTGAAKLLGLKHQTLISMLKKRHKALQLKRTPPEKRLKSIIKKDA
ncbi:MAG TPA: helix-turn-helix domain-containing protein [Pyrinomonadaceae bacterium]